MSDDIVDRIDQQLAAGEPAGGYDYGDPNYPHCPHCDRHWHGLALTAWVAAMHDEPRDADEYLAEYRADDDTTPIVCQGSMFIGPMPAEGRLWSAFEYEQAASYDPNRPPAAWVTACIQRRRWWRRTLPTSALTEGVQNRATALHRVTIGPASTVIDYLGEAPPEGYTWEPLTAPGVIAHPDGDVNAWQADEILELRSQPWIPGTDSNTVLYNHRTNCLIFSIGCTRCGTELEHNRPDMFGLCHRCEVADRQTRIGRVIEDALAKLREIGVDVDSFTITGPVENR